MRLLEPDPKALDSWPSVYRQWMEHAPKEFLRLKALCEAVDFTPPEGASEEEAGDWWVLLWEAPEDLHDKIWRMFPEYIDAQRRAIAEAPRVFSELYSHSLKSKKDTISRQAEDITRLDKEIQDLRRRIPKRPDFELDPTRQRVRLKGKWYDLTEMQVQALSVLKKAKGVWVTGRNCGEQRMDKMRKSLPKAVRSVVHTKHGPYGGYRLDPALFPPRR